MEQSKDKKVRNLDQRVGKIEDALAEAAAGNFSAEIPVSHEDFDELTSVEVGINILMSDLGEEVRRSQKRADELQDKLDLIRKQQEALEELSTPVITIWDRVLVIPLIGFMDTKRSQQLTENLLNRVAASQVEVVILDVTGVPMVDSTVANHLLTTVASLRLLGASCVISGIRPEVARTIVLLGVDLKAVKTVSSLSHALKWALRRLRLEIVEMDAGSVDDDAGGDEGDGGDQE